MASRTYTLRLMGDPAHTAEALARLDQLFAGEALSLLARELAPAGLGAQRLTSDGTEVVLFITPGASAAETPPETTLLAPAPILFAEAATHGGGGGAGSEDPRA